MTGTTKEKIVELGRDYIQQIGYHSFNYKQIASELNIKNAAIHHYYPSKEDLGVAVIEKDKLDFQLLIKRLENAPALEKAEALLYSYDQYFKKDRRLCVISTFGSVYENIPEKLRIASRQYFDVIISWLTAVFEEGLTSKEFRFKGGAKELANLWTATLPGSLQLGRIHGETYFDEVITGLRNSLHAAKK